MGLRQFATSLSVIYRSEHVNRPAALLRHLLWQTRKFGASGPITRRLSRSVLVDEEPGGVISHVNMLGLYDFNNMHFVELVLAAGGVFADVGANIGSYTLIASQNPEVAVVSLEPNPAAFAKLERNIARNARTNVTAINCGASARPGVLHMTDEGAAPTNRIVSDAGGGPRTIEVKVDTLDALCHSLGVLPRLIKIDVEGHEPQVLEGASASLGAALACIVEGGERGAVVDILSGLSMQGPFYYHHREAALSRQPSRLAEDPIFIGPPFSSEFPRIRIMA